MFYAFLFFFFLFFFNQKNIALIFLHRKKIWTKKDPQQIGTDLALGAIKLCCGLGPHRVGQD